MTHLIDGLILLPGRSLAASTVVKATFITAVGLIGAWLARRSRAAVRHAVLAASFAVLLALPVASILIAPIRIAVPAPAQERTAPFIFPASIDATQSVAPVVAGAGITSRTARWPVLSPLALLFAGWFAGAAFFLLRTIVGLRRVRSLRRFGLPWHSGQLVAERLALDAGIHRRVEVLLDESLPAPVTCGVVHPAIVLPPDAKNWNGEDLNRAIIHELEHVRRCDWMSHCLARIVCAMYWFHPLVWIAWRQLALEAELSCDEAVLARSEATAYADQLVRLARRLSVAQPPALAMASRSDLSVRVGSVLDGRRARGRAGASLVAVACAVAAAVVLTMSPLRMVAAPQGDTQAAAQDIPKWDAVSVKRCDGEQVASPEGRGAGNNTSTDRVTLNCQSLVGLVFSAYTVYEGGRYNGQVAGAVRYESFPEWTRSERYTIEAKAQGSPGQPMMRGPMLQTLLEDRFRLKVHTETKEGPVYILSVAKGGPQMEPLGPGGCAPLDLSALERPSNACPIEGHVQGQTLTWDVWTNMDSLTRRLTVLFADPATADTPVINKTGLAGNYHVHLEYANPRATATQAADVPSGPSIFSAVEKLGLKLEAGKAPRRFLVFDHADKVPTEN